MPSTYEFGCSSYSYMHGYKGSQEKKIKCLYNTAIYSASSSLLQLPLYTPLPPLEVCMHACMLANSIVVLYTYCICLWCFVCIQVYDTMYKDSYVLYAVWLPSLPVSETQFFVPSPAVSPGDLLEPPSLMRVRTHVRATD